jgi:hypothetical protein
MYLAMKAAIPKLVRILRVKGIVFEYALVWEMHKSGFPHAHLLQKGSYVPWHLMRSIWMSLNIGSHVHIRPVSDAKDAAFYTAKYMSKAVASLHTGLHVSRTIQISRGFFDRTLFKKSDAGTLGTVTVRTRRHMACVVQDLVEHHCFTLAEVDGVAAFALTPPPRMAWVDALALLYKLL